MKGALIAFGAMAAMTVGAMTMFVGVALRFDAQAAGMRPTALSTAAIGCGLAAMTFGCAVAWRSR